MSTVLDVIAIVLAAHIVTKFCFFALPYRFRRRQLDRSYRGRPSATGVSDAVSLGLIAVMVALLFTDQPSPTSFLIGLWAGATLIQTFFHRFHRPLHPDRAPGEPHSPIKTMSYAIQAAPARAWQELLLLSALSALGVITLALT